MKNKITTIILFLIMLVFILGVAAVGYFMYNDLTDQETIYKVGGIITEQPSEKTNDTPSSESESISNSIQSVLNNVQSEEIQTEHMANSSDISKYFYNQLDDVQKKLYDGLANNKQNLKYGDYVISYGNEFSDILSEENGGEKLGDDYQTAIEAFTHDNPDLFYIDVNKMYLNIKTITRLFSTSYEVYMSPAKGSNYLSDDFSNTEQIEQGIEAVERIKNYVLSNVKGTEYQKIAQIHNYLVDSIEYDASYKAIGTYGLYGALIAKKCVCEGYAKSFKYLANAAGFECEIMQGIATNSSGRTENHAWNCVKVDNNWYAVDPTWDDPIVIGYNGEPIQGTKSDPIKYKFFLRGSYTFEKDHKLEYQFSDGGKVFKYPTLSIGDYKK